MTATNHALTGALIGLTVSNPVLAVMLAFASHFALDAIPHFGFTESDAIGKDKFAVLLVCEALACLAIVVLLGLSQPQNWSTAVACAFAAAAPDFMWIPRFWRARSKARQKKLKSIHYFHHVIQWFQEPIGAVVELVWLISFGFIFLNSL